MIKPEKALGVLLVSSNDYQKSKSFAAIVLTQTVLFLLFFIPSMAAADSSSNDAKVHIVYLDRADGVEPEAHHIQTLKSVLGSEEAAKEALVYSYKHAANGFSAKLTPEQVSQLSKQPGVIEVIPSRSIDLHSRDGSNII